MAKRKGRAAGKAPPPAADPVMPPAAGLTPHQVVSAVRRFVGSSTCDQESLYELLCAEAEAWEMRLQEIEDEDEE